MSLNIIVCVKLVPDPEAPPTAMEVNAQEKRVVTKGVSPVINTFDESALEAAVTIKEKTGGAITLLSAGKNISRAVILKAMAAGVDEAILVEDNTFDFTAADSWITAAILHQAIKKMVDKFDLILCGRQASDTNAGQVGIGLSRLLDIPAVTLAQNIQVEANGVMVERVLPDGYEVLKVDIPALVTVSGEFGELRLAGIQDIKAAKKLPQKVLSLQDLEMAAPVEGLVETVSLAAPSRERDCRVVEGDTPAEAGKKLARKMQEDKVI